jgi:aldehyde:ferredoxin oxidoreductase
LASILKIDLSKQSYRRERIPESIIEKYIGGRGLGSYLLYKLVPPKADPMGEENHLIFTAGPLNGTGFYYSSKACLNTKSPQTGIYLYSISSTTLGESMRKADLWAIDIHGIADTPTYIVVDNDEVIFKDAIKIWGSETASAQKKMLEFENLSQKEASTVAIGPAGERLIPYAAVFSEGDRYRCWGRGGGGAVMGSKRLKGMVVKGDGKVMIHDEKKLWKIKKEVTKILNSEAKSWSNRQKKYETGADLDALNEVGILPTKNWQRGKFENYWKIDKSTTPMGWPEKGRSCAPYCPSPGCRDVEVKSGLYRGYHSDVEYETIYAFGSNCGVDEMGAIIAASQICDEFGVDTISAGVTMSFIMECFERGLITSKDTDGIELKFGNHEAMIQMLKKMARGEGFGNEIAGGVKRLSEKIKGSSFFAMHVKGLELGGYECRGANGQALQFAINARGGCHHGYGLPARKEAFDGTRMNIRGKGQLVKEEATKRIICDSLVICTFPRWRVFNLDLLAELIKATTGIECSSKTLEEFGLRVMCQERLFNMREGLSRKDDTLPERLLREPKPDEPEGVVVPLGSLLDEFYQAVGWDISTGNPPNSLLNKLGIER